MALITNAVEHTSKGFVRVTVLAETSTLTLSVRDTGEGILESDLPHIFERFYRVDDARDRAAGHVGLGLSIAARIAEFHQARTAVASVPGEGSTFTVMFPRSESHDES